MATKQTAVEWLFSQLPDHLRLSQNGFDMFQQAIAMERQQIEDAYNEDLHGGLSSRKKYSDGKEYYTETYGKE